MDASGVKTGGVGLVVEVVVEVVVMEGAGAGVELFEFVVVDGASVEVVEVDVGRVCKSNISM